MNISINEVDDCTVNLTVDDVNGIVPVLTIEGHIEPGQRFQAPTGRDPFGQEGIDADFEIDEIIIYVTDEYSPTCMISQVNQLLIDAGFYRAVMDELEEYCRL